MLLFRFTCFIFALIILDSSASNQGNSSSPFKILLGGLFSIYSPGNGDSCDETKLYKASVQRLEMTLFTIDKVNRNKSLLPGIKLVLQPEADCVVDTRALSLILQKFNLGANNCNETHQRTWGIIGTDSSAVSIPVAKLLGILRIPQISCGATSAELSKKERFPYFFRTVGSDDHVVEAIIDLLRKNNWNYVSFIYEDDKYGSAAFDAFQEKVRNTKICLAQSHKVPRDLSREINTTAEINIVEELLKEKPTLLPVITFVREYNLVKILYQIKIRNASHRIQWIGSDSWSSLNHKSGYTQLYMDADDMQNAMGGAIVFQQHSSINREFNRYLKGKTLEESRQINPFYADYLAYVSNCSLEQNSSNTCPSNLTIPANEKFSFGWEESCADSVLAYAQALDQARKDLCNDSDESTCTEFKNMNGTLLKNYLQNVSFENGNEIQFKFDDDHNGPTLYDVLTFVANSDTGSDNWELIGHYNNDNLDIDKKSKYLVSSSVWPYCSKFCDDGEFRVFQQDKTCCWNCDKCGANEYANYSTMLSTDINTPCIKCKDSEQPVNKTCVYLEERYLSFQDSKAQAVMVASGVGILFTILVGAVYFRFWNTSLIRASGRELSSLILFGVLLIFVTPVLFCIKPSLPTCIARKLFLGTGFAAIFSGLLIKTIRIAMIFNFLGKRFDRDYKLFLRPAPQFILAVVLTVVEILILVATSLQHVTHAVVPTPLFHEEGQKRFNYVCCDGMEFKDLVVGLLFPFILVLVCAVYAFRIRKVPDGFNEARHIAFVVYTTLVIWLAQLSTYFAQSKSKDIIREAVYCLFLLLNGLIMLLVFFGPRIYIVLWRPDKNNSDTVMGSKRELSMTKTNCCSCIEDLSRTHWEKTRSLTPVTPRLGAAHCDCCALKSNST